MPSEDIVARILRDYPSFAFLLNDPEIGPLLIAAVDPNVGFDAATFQAKLMQTNWWKTTSAPQRQWVTLLNTDPASANQQRLARFAEMRNYATSLGLQVSDQKLWDVTEISLHNGLAVNAPQIRDMLSWYSPEGAPGMLPDLRGMASRDYLVPLTDGDLGWWSREIAAGRQTADTYKTMLSTLAAGRFPHLKGMIDQGVTPGQFFAPYRNAIANELELGSGDQVDILSDPRWSQVTGVSGQDGNVRPMTMAEAIKLARSQDEWKQTRNGQALGGQMTMTLLKTFGER